MSAKRLRSILGCAVVAAAGTATPADAGTTYYVNGTCGQDAWSGTSATCAAPDGPKATIGAAIAVAANGDQILVAAATYGERIDFQGKAVVLRGLIGADVTIIDGGGIGPVVECVSGEGPSTVLEGFTIRGGAAGLGGGMYNAGSSPTIRDCVFTDNSADIGGAIRNQYGASPLIEGCSFIENTASVGGGAVVNSEGHPELRDCLFLHNHTGGGGGAIANLNATGGSVRTINCRFFQNTAGSLSSGVIDGSGGTYVNCVWSRNVSAQPHSDTAALDLAGGEPSVINCTIGGTTGLGVHLSADDGVPVFRNTIIWDNSGGSMGGGVADVEHCDIEGGHSGYGNLDADPLFVQPGTDNLRLGEGSPCVNAGNNYAIPSGIHEDLDGNPRIYGGTVDMGAYEGEYEGQAPAAGDDDLDNGEFVVLVPAGGPLDPPQTAAVIVVNHSGPDDATFTVTEYWDDIHPGAGGYSELGSILSLETSLADGQYRATVFLPMHFTGLDPVNRVHVNVTRYDAVAGSWSLAPTDNTVNSPGFDSPIGNRVVVLDGANWEVTQDVGDYGIFFDPASQQAFAWANVDVAQEFGLGVPLCPSDCRQTPDGAVGVADFLALLARWGDAGGGGPCDVDYDGVIGPEDFLTLVDDWGACGRSSMPAAGGPGRGQTGFVLTDVDGDGAAGARDLLAVMERWPAK
jgi:hypothetical protein